MKSFCARTPAWAELAPFEKMTAGAMTCVCIVGAAVLVTGVAPLAMGWVFLVAVTQAFAFVVSSHLKAKHRGLGRIGFHVGIVACFVMMPLFSSGKIAFAADDLHRDLGATILLVVVGFEGAYWTVLRGMVIPATRGARSRSYLWVAVIGVCGGIAYIGIRAIALHVSAWDVFYSLRGEVAAAELSPWSTYALVVAGGIVFLGACAAGAFLSGKSGNPLENGLCWSLLGGMAAFGFRQGSRAAFLYSCIPLASTAWFFASRGERRSRRWAVGGAGVVLVMLAWGVISSARGGDIRDFTLSWEGARPDRHAEGAFDIYSTALVIVEAFPAQFPYQYGRSLIPLILGWVPRTVWPSKPYPFSLYYNWANWETLDRRAASIAVGIPGEAYGNFGILGGLIWGALFGFGAKVLDRYVSRLSDKNPFKLQVAGVGAVWLALLVRGGVPEMFYMGVVMIGGPVLLGRESRTRKEMRGQ
jgi:hypothetical protein